MSFIISSSNSLTFKEINNLLPNYENTLDKDVKYEGVIPIIKCQKFLTSDTITTQIKTNYVLEGGDSITATLVSDNGVETDLPVSLIYTFNDELLSEISSFFEFYIVGQTVGKYQVRVKAVKSGEENQYRICEPFELTEGLTERRYTEDGSIPYQHIPNHYKIEATNVDKSFYLYYGSDRISGDPLVPFVWASGVFGKPQSGGEVDTYNNLGNLDKLEQESQRIFEFKSDDIPDHLALKVQEFSALDFFSVNGIEFVSTENGEIERFGNYTGGVLTMNFTQAFVIGINSDDSGFNIPSDTDMKSVIPKVIDNASGAHQLVIDGGYSLNQITIEPKSGTSVDVKIGTTPSGSEILRTTNVLTDDVVKNIARNFVNPLDPSASFTAYIEISGVGASAKVTLQTIINKQ